MNASKMLIATTLVGSVSAYCYGQALETSARILNVSIIQESNDAVMCEANGKSYTIGAAVFIGKNVFQCVSALQNPHNPHSVVANWVQISLK